MSGSATGASLSAGTGDFRADLDALLAYHNVAHQDAPYTQCMRECSNLDEAADFTLLTCLQ
jgi:hypothetical protein